MDKNLSEKRVSWHILLLATGLMVASLAIGLLIYAHIANSTNTLLNAAKIIPEKGTIALVHINKNNHRVENIVKEMINLHEDWIIELLETPKAQGTIASTTNGWIVVTNNQDTQNIPPDWHTQLIDGLTVISNYTFEKDIDTLANNSRFSSTINNINTSDDVIFYINTDEWVQNSPKLYFGWKKFLPETLQALAGTLHGNDNSINITAFLGINKNILPDTILNRNNFFTGSIITKRTLENGSFIASKELKQVIQEILIGLEKTNLPLAIELKKGINNLQKTFFLEGVPLESILSLLENETLFELDSTANKFALLSAGVNSKAMDDIQESLKEKSRFLSPQKKYYELPDKSTGAERIANREASVSNTTFHEVALASIELINSTFRPTFGKTDNAIFIASSPEEAIKIITDEHKEIPNFFKKTYAITFQLNPKTLPEELIPINLDTYDGTVSGGITLFENGIFIEMTMS